MARLPHQARPGPASPQLAEIDRLQQAGRLKEAAALARRVTAREPRNARALYSLGACLLGSGDIEGAIRPLEQAAKLNPNPAILFNLAQALTNTGRLERAHGAIDQALRLNPNHPFCLSSKVELLATEARFDEAAALLEGPVSAEPVHPAVVIAFARIAHRVGQTERAIELIRRSLASRGGQIGRPGSIERSNHAMMLFRLGDLLDRAGRYDDAFEAYEKANRAVGVRFDAGAHAAVVDRVIRGWSAEAVRGAARVSKADERPVFIVGMPRSGTTLAEQILDAHPEVAGLGERPEVAGFVSRTQAGRAVPMLASPEGLERAALERFARQYAEPFRAEAKKAGGAGEIRYFTDKMPTNFLHLGVIALAFPGARVIHCRRNPLDTCLSCYFQHFGPQYPFIYDLHALGRFYREYERLMEHWRSVLDVPILDLDYESLVAEQEARTARLLDFLDLDFDEACLRFHESKRTTITASNEQVRRPLYASSVSRHQRYEVHLGPLRKGLGLES